VPAVSVMPTDAEFTVAADGELIASESMPISLPGSIRMAFNIAWLAPEFSEVKKGEVVARFDDVQVQLNREDTFLEVARSEFDLAGLARAEELERTRIDHEAVRVEGERNITETFEDVDERLFSRNEIIDALSDLDYLDVQSDFLEWQFDTFDQRTEAEKNTILARREGELDKLEKQDTALAMMELRSPADGTFIYARTPWGRKLGKGQTVHPGRPVGLLPLRGKVKARIYVPEADAVGLAKGQAVRFRLDAASDSEFSARVEAVSPVASPRDRDDPRKFFSVDAAIDDVDPDLMRVGSRIRARIITGRVEGGFVVPAQSIYGNSRDAYVYVVDGGGTERRDVTLGLRSPDRVEITSGLEKGERVSLVPPPDAG
jgi:HlyD family secretion protein